MKRFSSIILFLVLCFPQCTLLRTRQATPPKTIIIPVKEIPKTAVTPLVAIDTNRPAIKTVYITQIVPDKNYYNHVDSILNKRMSLYADSNRVFIGSQLLVLSDYKAVLVNNIKLIDSLKKLKQEKTILKSENKEKDETITNSSRIDYYTANIAWATMMTMLIFVIVRQYSIRNQILQELRSQV